MKTSLFKRLVIFAHWLLSIIVCLLALLSLDFWPLNPSVEDGILSGLVSALVLCAFSAAAMVVWVFRRTDKQDESGFITVHSDEAGRTRIAVNAIEQMIRQAVRGVDGIMDMKSTITDCGEAISVEVNLSLLKGVHLPTATQSMQQAIRSYIEQNCGVAVREVSIDVQYVETDAEDPKRGRRKKVKTVEEAPAALPVEEIPAEEAPAAEDAVAEEASGEEAVDAELPEMDDEIVLTLDPVIEPIGDAGEASDEEPKSE